MMLKIKHTGKDKYQATLQCSACGRFTKRDGKGSSEYDAEMNVKVFARQEQWQFFGSVANCSDCSNDVCR